MSYDRKVTIKKCLPQHPCPNENVQTNLFVDVTLSHDKSAWKFGLTKKEAQDLCKKLQEELK